MAVRHKGHRQKIDFSKYFGSKPNCGLKDDSENLSVKYVNKRYSPNHTNSGNRPSCDHTTITITVKTKTDTEQKKQKTLKENKTTQRSKKSTGHSHITIDDYLKVLAKKCSTPDMQQTYAHRNQKKQCSDTCLNTSTPFKTKTIVNAVSLDPKKIPPDFKNLVKHLLMQGQFSIYRCQQKKDKENGCRACTSAAIFEVVKCLYDCHKKKKCDPCKCVVCGYLPRDLRKLINEVGRTSASIGVETPSTNRKTRSTMTSQEDELLSMLQNAPKPERPKITPPEVLRIAKAFGIMVPEVLSGTPMDRELHQKKYNTGKMTKIDAPYPKDNNKLEKMFYRTNLPEEGPSQRVPSKKLRKARASGLLTPLEGKTEEQKEKMIRNLAMKNIPLPEGNTESEKNIIAKVRRDVGLPPGPRNVSEKEKYARAQAAGLITPLKGKSQLQKENILKALLENGIPLPEGRTPSERALIEKIKLNCLSNAMFRCDAENTIKSRARSYVQTLFNKFSTETGYMVLVETSCVNDKFYNLLVKGLTPIEGNALKEEVNKPLFIWPKETGNLEKELFKEVVTGVRLVPESQGKTKTGKLLRGTAKECVQFGKISSKKTIKNQPDSKTFLEVRITEPKVKLLPSIAIAGNPFLKSKSSLDNLLDRILKDKARTVISKIIDKPKGSESESEQTNVVKRLADAGLSLTEDYVPLQSQNVNKVRDTTKVSEKHKCQTKDVGTIIPQRVSKGMAAKLISHAKENLYNTLERNGVCDMKKLSFRNSYLRIKLSLTDISKVSTPKGTRSVFTDTKDIKQIRDISTSLPSVLSSSAADETESSVEIPTKEIKKKNININSSNNKILISSGTNSTTEDLLNDDTDNASQSHENTYERDFEENNADLIYIYKPTLEIDGKENLTTSSRIIQTDSGDITSTSSQDLSGSLYLIETVSTTSYDSAMTDFSYATKETSDAETGTDVYYIQKSEDEHSKDTSSEPRIFWFYRNKVVKTYLVPEVKFRQDNEPAQRTTKQLDFNEHRTKMHNSKNKMEVMQSAPRKDLRRSSSFIIVMSPSNHDEFSSEELGSLIYIGKLDSVSKLKNIKFVPHENTQKVDPTKMCRLCTRNEEKSMKCSVDPKTALRSSGIGSKTPGHPSFTNAFTRYPCNKGTYNQGNRLEYSAAQCQQQRIPPKYVEYQKITEGRPKWKKGLRLKLSSSTTCRLDSGSPEQRGTAGYSGKQRMGPNNLEINLYKTGPERESQSPACEAITRYLNCGKSTVYREKPKWFPDQQLVTKSSKVCLISTAHSSRYKVHSKVSFSDEIKLRKQGKFEPYNEKYLNPDFIKSPPENQEEKVKTNREKRPQFTITVSPNVSSKYNLTSGKSNKGSKVRFDHPLPTCCPCESQKRGSLSYDHQLKVPQQLDSDCTKKQSEPYENEKNESKTGPMPEKPRSKICCPRIDCWSKNGEKSTNDAADKQIASQGQPDDDNDKLSQQKALEIQENSTQDSTEQSTAECIKQQMVTEQLCPPNSTQTLTDLPADECVNLRQQMTSECSPNSTEDSITQPANECCKLSQQTEAECSENSTQDSSEQPTAESIMQQMVTEEWCPPNSTPILTELPADECVNLCQQMASECQGNSTQYSMEQPLIQRMTTECPANSTQDSITHPVDEDVKLSQQTASECPVNSTQESIIQPADKNADPAPSLIGDSTEQPDYVNEVDACCTQYNNRGQPQSSHGANEAPCTQKSSRLWWSKKKKQVMLRLHSRPPPPCSVEEKTVETQCERDVRDLAQMTDSLRELARNLAQCNCGETVAKPCQCLQELITKTITSGRLTTKKNSKCECPPPIVIIKGGTAAKRNEKEVNSLTEKIEQKLDCSCADYVDKCNIKPCQSSPPPSKTQVQNDTSGGACKKVIICECPRSTATGQTTAEQNGKDGMCEGLSSDQGDKEKYECPRPAAAGENAKDGTCQGMTSDQNGKKNTTCECECPRPTAAGLNGKDGTCQEMTSDQGGRKDNTCEFPRSTAEGQNGKDGPCQGMKPAQGGKKNNTCEIPQPTSGGQDGRDGTCQEITSDQSGKKKITCKCPRPTNIVREHTTAVQGPEVEQPSCDTLDPCQVKQTQAQHQEQDGKKAVMREICTKDKPKFSCPNQNTGGQKKKLCISLRKRSHKTTESSSGDDGMECQSKKSSGVKWCQKKSVISECPTLPTKDNCDETSLSPERKKQLKKIAKIQAKIKTGENKIDTSCTHGAAPCLCKDVPLCQKKKNYKCECPCPSFVEEVDLNHNIKDSPAPPCPPKDEKGTNIQKTGYEECDQGQMTEGKVDKCSYTDRPIKDLCKKKNKASGSWKRGKKQIGCTCRPDPPKTDRGCDPPCVKDQWKMKSRETCNRSGFSVRKKPAATPRVDYTMCFEEALAYFDKHPEDDPMRKKKKKVICECPPLQCCDSYDSAPLQFCFGGS